EPETRIPFAVTGPRVVAVVEIGAGRSHLIEEPVDGDLGPGGFGRRPAWRQEGDGGQDAPKARPHEPLHAEQRLEAAPEDALLLLRGETGQPLHPRDRRGIPRDEGPVAAEHDAVGADLVEQEAERSLVAGDGVVEEPALVRARRLLDVVARFRARL